MHTLNLHKIVPTNYSQVNYRTLTREWFPNGQAGHKGSTDSASDPNHVWTIDFAWHPRRKTSKLYCRLFWL